MSEDGTIAFIATLTQGVGGVDATNNMGIWVRDPGRRFAADRPNRRPDRRNPVIEASAGPGPAQLDMSEGGVAWIGDFPARSSAIVFSSLPSPKRNR
jgi:hypothetical protein